MNKKIVKLCLACIVIVVCCLMFTAAPGQAYAASATPAATSANSSCTYRATDAESIFPYQRVTLAGHPATYHWDISILSFHTC